MPNIRISNSKTIYLDNGENSVRISDHAQKKRKGKDMHYDVIVSKEKLEATNVLLGYMALKLLVKEPAHE